MRRILIALALLAIAVTILSCSGPSNQNEILIGEYSSLTGTTATFGQSTHHGLMLAVEEVNASGGVLGKKIRMITEDDQSKPEEAAIAATKLITRDKVKAIIGEVASSRSLAAAPICQENRIPMISPASTNPAVTQKGDYIFRVCYIDPFQGEVMGKFVFNSLKLTKAAILKDVKNDYSIGLAQFFTDAFTKMGGTIVAVQAYSEGDTDFKAQLTALKATNPEVVIVPGYYTEAALIVKQGRDLNMNMPFVGGDGWDSSKLIEIGGPALNNTYYNTHYSPDDTSTLVRNFVTKYESQFHEVPDAMGALGYDAIRILFDAILRAGSTDGPQVRDALAATKDFDGVTGKISIDSDRNARKSAVIIAVSDGKPHYRETIQP
jgi:branched-chain amino acid transport system substrate-binding protein